MGIWINLPAHVIRRAITADITDKGGITYEHD